MSRTDRRQKQMERAQEQLDSAQERMDRAQDQVARRLERAGGQIERAREKVERARESGSIWTRPEPGARSPRFSRELLAAKAMEIADAEGLDAVSMRRVASELGAGTMTLYHYVGNKQELLELMDDAMMAELLVDPERLEGGWRDALRAIAQASIETWMRHPWLHEIDGEGPSLGPNGIRHMDQSLQAVADTGLSRSQKLEIVSQVDDYVAGYIQREQDLVATPDSGSWNEQWDEIIRPFSAFIDEQLAGGEYPHLQAFLDGDDFAAVVREIVDSSAPMERFERGLERLLDGVELEIKRAAGPA